MKTSKTQLLTSVALSSTLALAATTVNASQNPFSVTQLESGYQLAMSDSKTAEGKCGEGKCGAADEAKKATEGKCGEGKCAASNDTSKSKEGKCGEGKCAS